MKTIAATPPTEGLIRPSFRRAVATLQRVEPHAQSAQLLLLRLLYGGLLVQTGWGKLMNLERTAGFFEGLGLPAPAVMAVLVAGTELAGGILLVLGAGARLAALALTTVMLTALATAHPESLRSLTAFTEQPPYPFLVATLIVLAFGAGGFSVDGWLRATRESVATDRD